jgi:threonine/homoserine/homoserine lactone efflux protein
MTGSLPLGNLNVAAMQIAIKETLWKAIWFSIGVIIVEVAYLIITLSIIGKYAISEKIFFYFQLLSIAVLVILAIGSFNAAGNKSGKNTIIDNRTKRFHLGVLMSSVNPLQIPFWAGWVVYLISRSLIVNTWVGYALFALSVGLGTFIALLVFVFIGNEFSVIMMRKQKHVNTLIGCLFAVMAIFQIFKLWHG